ncbi:MAG: hypothetical protein U0R79_03225 [Propionicimonas sp.]
MKGWKDPAHLWPTRPVRAGSRATPLVAPFDSLVFDRARLLQVFGTHYRIGLYTPRAERVHGYYVFLPLRRPYRRPGRPEGRPPGVRAFVQSSWLEEDAPEAETAARLAAEPGRMAEWLQLADVVVSDHGTLAASLRSVVWRRAAHIVNKV